MCVTKKVGRGAEMRESEKKKERGRVEKGDYGLWIMAEGVECKWK